jgi:hypothetical protein
LTVEQPLCSASRKDGSACRGRATPSGFCFAHDPELAGKRSQARRQGGFASSRRSRLARQFPEDLEEIRAAARDAYQKVLRGTMDPRSAQALALLLNFLLKIHEVGDTEARLRAVEAGSEHTKKDGSANEDPKQL